MLNVNKKKTHTHTFSIYMVSHQLHFCIHHCSDDIKRPWDQCWYHLLIQIVYSKDVLSHVPTPPSRNVAPDFTHHSSDVLHCPGAKWHHAQAVLVVYVEEPASPYTAKVCSNIGHWLSYQLAWDDQVQVHYGWRTWPA